ncbi:hypothetical protein EPUS_06970 [Endocarpon pusillum Z07020]|uniref:Glycine-rich domain-containing protein 1 n=1 Tax=Endocarpon pusillum (strain Z07020 / HMAS-L-300199) TaxID=1263415 RepID=U1GFI7_ENDPU|nr:uncharacterized protein EPUS_06970 [Endocarpon pusillum Z07020]ERF76412.1 hypothetical protein EPUS_06970 [Endocarpon pusillum Z07020]
MALLSDVGHQTLHQLSQASMTSIAKHLPTRYKTAPTKAQEPLIPSPDTFGQLESPAPPATPAPDPSPLLPTVAECAVHLELLETFYVLRQRILKSETLDTVFDLKENPREVTRRDGTKLRLKDTTLWTRREQKWHKYLELAVVRFLAWWKSAPCATAATRNSHPTFLEERLPPLDVIMVWHAALLNPATFKSRYRDSRGYKLHFPWRAIHQAIDHGPWTYQLRAEASQAFKKVTGLEADLFAQLESWASLPTPARTALTTFTVGTHHDSTLNVLTQGSAAHHLLQCVQTADSTLALGLREAIIRQTSFVDKMNAHLWIRSPALGGTLRRARSRYDNFLQLIRRHPTTMMVPTLDIDLVWHTHQCSAAEYRTAMLTLAGKFVNHDDSIVKSTLSGGFARTTALFRVHFAAEYPICGCWDCEALLSALVGEGRQREGDAGEDDNDDAQQPALDTVVEKVAADVAYHRAVELARRAKKPLPVRERA